MKVAPWLMLSNQQASEQVWAIDQGAENAAFRAAFPADQLKTSTSPDSNSFFQDHAEVGYTHMPGGPKTHSVFQLPQWGPNQITSQLWPRKLLGENVGWFTIGAAQLDEKRFAILEGGGGNLELLPPTTANPLGQIVVGENTSARLLRFLESQGAQPIVKVPTNWLKVKHVDEVVSFDRTGNKVFVADPDGAYKLLEAIPAADRGSAVFFTKGGTKTGAVTAASAVTPNKRIEIGLDLRADTKWKYIRIYESDRAGQIARISKWENGYVEIDRVWDTGTTMVGADTSYSLMKAALNQGDLRDKQRLNPTAATFGWFRTPVAGDKFVLLEDTLMGQSGEADPFPMAVTVAEVLRDAEFKKINQTLIPGEIQKVKDKLLAAAGGAGTLVFVPLPVLFFGKVWTEADDFRTKGDAFAFTPNLVNHQIVGEKYYLPNQFGPRVAGEDIFEKAAKDKLGAAASFVDGWTTYHIWLGEVHCGTLVKRSVLGDNWWTK